ncbi:MAG: Gfo/Idh/MocA family oxidoreductase, partial [Cyclobacteriaceae bacterium]|nr:Gfo/Idh/MocA family oxidoreductase [Cyclobacteriaceae bacterium]
MKDKQNRRSFVKNTLASSIGLGLATSTHAFNILPSFPVKDKLKVAIMGVNGRGMAHAEGFANQENAIVSYIADVDSRAMEKGVAAVKAAGQKDKVKGISDFRKALESKDVDILSIAAPDHWHTPASLMGLEADKHIYVEKPGSHNPAEGELLINAAKKHGKIVQMGNQRRSWPRVIEALKELHGGVIGRVYFARAWYTNSRPSIGQGKIVPVPEWLDFDLWQGPAPRKEFLDNLVPYNWHWRWHWGTGELLNNGTHFIDLARLGLQVDFPKKVYSTGGRYQYNDDWETPDTQLATFDFEGGKTISWEGRSCNNMSINGMGSGVSFHGEEGTLEINDNSYKIYDKSRKLIKEVESSTNTIVDQKGPGFDLDKDHFSNFLNSITGSETPNSLYSDSFKSVLLCHLGNISYRKDRALHCDPTN